MQRIETQPNISQLWQPLPESTQKVIRGGASDYLLEIEGIRGETTQGGGTLIPIKIKHNA
jgi:hypothetical protein